MAEFAALVVGLLFSFVNDHLDEPVLMLSFPPSIFKWVEALSLFAATFIIRTCVSQYRSWFILIRF